MGFMQGGLINSSRAAAYADKVIKTFAVKALGPRSTAGSLSGGNLQKFIMGREILQEPTALVVSQPTWGVDAGAAGGHSPGHRRPRRARLRGGRGFAGSRRIAGVLRFAGRHQSRELSRVMKVGEVSIEEIGLLMGGVHGDPEATVEMTEALHAHPI